MTNLKIAAITILYNPDEKVKKNLSSYSPFVDYCILIDNSNLENDYDYFCSLNEKYIYIKEEKNVGIGKALNDGCNIAIEKGMDLVLTMDQDSLFEKKEIKKFISTANQIDWTTVGILSPFHLHQTVITGLALGIESKLYTMTSGNLLNLSIYKNNGIFREDFFIDHIDHEYGLRLNMNNFQVLQANNIYLKHQLGELKCFSFFDIFRIKIISHSPFRVYYIIKNGITIINLYGQSFKGLKSTIAKIIVKEILKTFFEPNKKQRLSFIFKAFFKIPI